MESMMEGREVMLSVPVMFGTSALCLEGAPAGLPLHLRRGQTLNSLLSHEKRGGGDLREVESVQGEN